MRQFRYPTAIPPLETRPVDPQTGTWTYEWRSWFEAMQLQAGGQGGDAIYDIGELAANAEQIALLRRDVQRLQQDLEAVRATSEAAITRKILRDDVITNEIVNRALASRAATSTDFSNSNAFGPFSMDQFSSTVFSQFDGGSGTGDSPGRELLAVEVTINNANPGDPLLVWFDGQLNYKGGVAQWVCFHEKVWIMADSATFKNDFFGATAPRSLSDDDYFTVTDGARSMTRLFNRVQEYPVNELGGAGNISGEANNSNQVLSIPINGMTVTTAPADISTVAYKIVYAFVIDRDQVSYQSSNNNGWKNGASSGDDWTIEDMDVVVMNLKEKQ